MGLYKVFRVQGDTTKLVGYRWSLEQAVHVASADLWSLDPNTDCLPDAYLVDKFGRNTVTLLPESL